MNTLWSDCIQGVQTLYLSRALRFDDRFAPRFLPLLSLDPTRPMDMLEVGCGPGALCGALARWYPLARVTGLDLDDGFLRFAREHVSGASFVSGDATALPFPDASFDVTLSNTVSEHVEPSAFFGEQRRVLRPGGKCVVLSTRRGLSAEAKSLALSPEEEAFWAKAETLDDPHAPLIGRYALGADALPAKLSEMGFTAVRSGYALVDLTPDSPDVPEALALRILEEPRQAALEALESALRTFPGAFSQTEADAVRRRIQERFDRRLAQYRRGEKQWDCSVTLIQAVTAIRP